MLQSAGLAAVDTRPARTAEEAARLAAALGFPVALKIELADIPHKTEVGGVALGLGDADAVREAFEAVMASARSHMPAAKLGGVLVQKMARPGAELVLGLRRDPVFGHVVMVGLGGILVEVLKDVAFGQVPVAPGHALRMLHGLRGRAILDGARGQPPVDYQALARGDHGAVRARHPASRDRGPGSQPGLCRPRRRGRRRLADAREEWRRR